MIGSASILLVRLLRRLGMDVNAVNSMGLTALHGDGGIIAVAPDGQMAWSFNTSGMYRARMSKGQPVQIGIYKDEK